MMRLDRAGQIILAVLLIAWEAAQTNLPLGSRAHAAMSMFVAIVLGLVVRTAGIRVRVPHDAALGLSGGVGALLVFAQSLRLGAVGGTALAVALAVAAAFGVGPEAPGRS